MNIKEKLFENLAVKTITGLLIFLIAFIGKWLSGFLSSVWDLAVPTLDSKQTAGVLMISTLIFLSMIAVLFIVNRQRKKEIISLKKQIEDDQNNKLYPKFGILWDKEGNPYCPNDETPLTICGHCRKCKTEHYSGGKLPMNLENMQEKVNEMINKQVFKRRYTKEELDSFDH
ncbi:MAG TPA: hypothetical protein DHW82_09685 [Spirochaetia bacterium]|nr:MAG: hypothetical protein A2Y41_00475 [Spirochaetes bacterium GWB1_36_13]HCL57262.1 hypothetical protein [Spirochaetia bacterium]